MCCSNHPALETGWSGAHNPFASAPGLGCLEDQEFKSIVRYTSTQAEGQPTHVTQARKTQGKGRERLGSRSNVSPPHCR